MESYKNEIQEMIFKSDPGSGPVSHPYGCGDTTRHAASTRGLRNHWAMVRCTAVAQRQVRGNLEHLSSSPNVKYSHTVPGHAEMLTTLLPRSEWIRWTTLLTLTAHTGQSRWIWRKFAWRLSRRRRTEYIRQLTGDTSSLGASTHRLKNGKKMKIALGRNQRGGREGVVFVGSPLQNCQECVKLLSHIQLWSQSLKCSSVRLVLG